MNRRLSSALFVGVTLGAVALTIGGKALAGQESAPAANPGTKVVEAPASNRPGWRWESYSNVQLQVPDDWAQALWAGRPGCAEDDWWPEPAVLRPGGMRPLALKVCPASKPAEQVAPSVVFDGERPGVVPLAGGWVRETRKIGEVLVTVTAGDDVLRREIFDSARVVETIDSYGCAPRTDRRVERPPARGGIKSVGDVVGVSVCRYSIAGLPIAPTGGPEDLRFARLQASSRLTGAAADHLVRDLVAAPPGAGPNLTAHCAPDPGQEFLVLRVQGSKHTQDVFYRYDGCRANGTDDSSVRRQLTAETARQLFIGVHQLSQSHPALDKLLIGTPPPVR